MQAHQRAELLQALPQAARPSTLTEKKYPMYWFPLSGTSLIYLWHFKNANKFAVVGFSGQVPEAVVDRATFPVIEG